MSIRRGLILGWMVVGLQILAAGQNPAPQNTPSQNPPSQTSGDTGGVSDRTAPAAAVSAIAGMQIEGGAEETSDTLPQIPSFVGGKGISTTVLSKMERSNYLRAGLNVGAAYDDNPFLVSNGAQSNTSVTIFPNISIQESTSRIRWTLGYAAGLTINQNLTNQNQGAHNLNFDSEFRLSPHVNLRAAETFSMTTGFFDSGNGTGVVGSGGPNASLVAPLSTQRSSVTTVETNYHFALNDLIGASGTFSNLHFTNPPKGTVLADSQTATGSAFWLHRLVGQDWGGVSYHFERITFDPLGETIVHSFLVMNSLSLSKRFTLTGFVGPQYSENSGLVSGGGTEPVQSNGWTVSGGVEGGWRNEHTSVSAGYSRGVSDGGGLLGSVLLQTVHGTVSHQLTPAWAAALNASYGANQSLVAPSTSSASSINLTSAGVSVERNVGKSLGLRLGYAHDFQEQFGLPALNPTQDAHRNRFFVTLSYQWAKPLGM
ncbi:MAG: hypothetical protein LAO30_13950 [Acidobacteriia bacterium]|nr:hypothetical protein [Terriglobia bacterium]